MSRRMAELGDAGRTSSMALVFRRGPYYVKLTAFDADAEAALRKMVSEEQPALAERLAKGEKLADDDREASEMCAVCHEAVVAEFNMTVHAPNRAGAPSCVTCHGDGAERAMMVGNSMKSDVVPVVQAGGWGVFVPHGLTWELEHAVAPEGHPRYRELETLGGVRDLVAQIES